MEFELVLSILIVLYAIFSIGKPLQVFGLFLV